MQVSELFEGIATFSVEHQNGPHKRVSGMSINKIIDSIMFSPAEKKRISKLEVGSNVTTQRTGEQGRTVIRVTRTS
jgi:hypothetical protein